MQHTMPKNQIKLLWVVLLAVFWIALSHTWVAPVEAQRGQRGQTNEIINCDDITPENAAPGLQCLDTSGRQTLLCTLTSPEAGVYIPECEPYVNDFALDVQAGRNSMRNAQQLNCDDITPEIAANGLKCVNGDGQVCTLVAAEAGVYSLQCLPSVAGNLSVSPAQTNGASRQTVHMSCDDITPENAAPGLQCTHADGQVCTLVAAEAGVYSLDCSPAAADDVASPRGRGN